MKNLIKILKSKEVRESFRKTSKELAREIVGFSILTGVVLGGIYGIEYTESNKKDSSHNSQNFIKIDEKGNCIKYVSRAGYFDCYTNKHYR